MISKIPQVMVVYNITRDSDIMVVAKFRTSQQFSDFTKNVTKMPHVVRRKTHVGLNTLKKGLSILPKRNSY